jgi:type II secretory pathway pseudopilin PulG
LLRAFPHFGSQKPQTKPAAGFSNFPITQFPNHAISRRQQSQRGYILLILLLFVAVLSIGFLVAVQKLEFQIKRDREEEMIHRGVQYSRAVRRFFKKTGRYPTRIEELESTNNIRFLRRRYKDPLNRDPKTGQERDFKLLHLQDVRTSFSTGNAAATPGLVAASDLAGADPGLSNTEVHAGAPGALNANSSAASGRGPSAINPQDSDTTSVDGNDAQAQSNPPNSGPGTPPAPQPLSQQLGPNGAPQVFGGGGIVGVASANKDKTIRVFNKKDHYNQWQFIYDPTTDRGGLLMTPNQPPLLNAVQNVNQQQQNGQPGQFVTNQPGGLNSPGSLGNQQNNNTNNNQNNAPQTPNIPPDQNQ